MSEEEITEKENPSLEEIWIEVSESYEEITKDLPGKIPYEPELPFSFYWTVQHMKGGLKYRTINLAKTAMKLFKEEEGLLSAIIITRSICETVSLLFWLYMRIEKVVKNGEVGDLKKSLITMAVGRRLNPIVKGGEEIKAFSALSAIDKLDKNIEGVRKHYDSLSEYAHPNNDGVLLFFTQLNKKENYFEMSIDAMFQKKEMPQKEFLAGLSLWIGTFIVFERMINELLPKFKEICEEEGD